MNQITDSQPNEIENGEVDLLKLWQAIWEGKLIIIGISAVFAITSVFYALSQPNIYQATVLLAPANSQGGVAGLSKMAGQLGGFASIAGLNLGGGSTDKTGLAIEVLKSRRFIENFITTHELLAPLMAAKSWDKESNTLIFNEEVYDPNSNTWLPSDIGEKSTMPSLWQAYQYFQRIVSVNTDKETGMITLTIDFYSPERATQWLKWLVEDINATMRESDNEEAKNSIDFLSVKLQETKLADMKEVFYQLIEEQTKTLMLAEVSKEYVFKTIDPPNAPETKARPKRPLIVVLGTMLGGMLALGVVLVRSFARNSTVVSKNG